MNLSELTLDRKGLTAATALEILDPRGREMGILSGANVLMPNITPR